MSDAAIDYEAVNEDEDTTTGQATSDQGSQGDEGQPRDVGGVGGERLRSFVERIERLEEEKSHLAEDIKEVYAELKGVGFDAKTVRKVIALRKLDSEKRRESEELLDLYKTAIGMV